jgi:hypothetical protein
MSDVHELYEAMGPRETARAAIELDRQRKAEREKYKGLSPSLARVYELWDAKEEPTEKAMEARRIVSKAGAR